jgi:hypothetical protein
VWILFLPIKKKGGSNKTDCDPISPPFFVTRYVVADSHRENLGGGTVVDLAIPTVQQKEERKPRI